MGSYHGKFGFDTFSHMKSVMEKSRFIDFSFFYAPDRKGLKLLKRIFRLGGRQGRALNPPLPLCIPAGAYHNLPPRPITRNTCRSGKAPDAPYSL